MTLFELSQKKPQISNLLLKLLRDKKKMNYQFKLVPDPLVTRNRSGEPFSVTKCHHTPYSFTVGTKNHTRLLIPVSFL